MPQKQCETRGSASMSEQNCSTTDLMAFSPPNLSQRLIEINQLIEYYQIHFQQTVQYKFESLMHEYQEKALPLVQVDHQGKYCMHPVGEQFLKQVPKPIAIISVAGLYRTGKSYLLNRIILNRNQGFGVGPTINPCTKGLWVWGTPIKGTTTQGEKINVLIIDSEGIGALDEDQNHDTKIFTLAILTSSTFIYNSVGSIDQNALQNLSLVVNLTKNIRLTASKQLDQEQDDSQELAQYFPSFFWVVRDFSLQLINQEGEAISSKEYLQKALAPQKGFSDDIEQKNRIRRLLSTFFRERQCATLVRPLVNEQMLQSLEKCNFEDLRPEFVEQALILRKRVLHSAKPKLLRGQPLDGSMYVSLVKSYLNAINNGGVPNIENAWTYMCIEKCIKLQQACMENFDQSIQKQVVECLPLSTQQFDETIEVIENECYEIFKKEQIGSESQQYFKDLQEKIKSRVGYLRTENERQSISILKNYILKNFSGIEKKMRMNEYESFQDFQKSINNFYQHLIENGPNLPKKQIVYLDFLKKVISQGAEVFIKQANLAVASFKQASKQKQKALRLSYQELNHQFQNQIVSLKDRLKAMTQQKIQSESVAKEIGIKMVQQSDKHKAEVAKIQSNYENRMKTLQIKLQQSNMNLSQYKQKKLTLQSMQMIERKQRQKEKAIMQLKMNQIKAELQMLKQKQMQSELAMIDLNISHSAQAKQISLNYQNKIEHLVQQNRTYKHNIEELEEKRQFLERQVASLQQNAKLTIKKYQEELRVQMEKYQTLRCESEEQKNSKINALEEQNKSLMKEVNDLRIQKEADDKQHKELNDRIKNLAKEYQTETAILLQKVEFMQHELTENKQTYEKNIDYYENLIRNQQNQQKEDALKQYQSKLATLEQQNLQKIQEMQAQITVLKEKQVQQIDLMNNRLEKQSFEAEIERNALLSELSVKNAAVTKLEQENESLYVKGNVNEAKLMEQFKKKEQIYQTKIKDLEIELETSLEKASEQQTEYSNRSQESLRQLKNYYQLQKQKLQSKIVMEKDKYERKIEKLIAEYESKLDEEARNLEEDYELLKEEYMNEVSVMKELITNLQHENDSKTKQIENVEKRHQEERAKLEKRQVQLTLKLENAIKTAAVERQNLQIRIHETMELKNQLQKESMMANHQKLHLQKQLQETAGKLQAKIEEALHLQKTVERQTSENRQKMNDMSNENMNERINFEKKLALLQQEKQFYGNRIEELEKQTSKYQINAEEKVKKMRSEMVEQMRDLTDKKNAEIQNLEVKYEKLKKSMKENEQTLTRNIIEVEKQLALEKEKYSNLEARMIELEQKKLNDGDYLQTELVQAKSNILKISKESNEIISQLKIKITQLENDKNEVSVLFQRQKILWQNKNVFLQDSKQKSKKQNLQKIKNLQNALQNLQKVRQQEKLQYETVSNESMSKLQRKYTNNLNELSQTMIRKQRQSQAIIKKLQAELRNITEKLAHETQSKQQAAKISQRRIKELLDSEKRALAELQKYKSSKEVSNIESLGILEREREAMKSKLQEKEQRYKNLQKVKQQLYYDFQKQKAKWNLEKQNYLMKNDELKETIGKQERDLERLQRENQKLKVEKKCSKMAMPNFSRYSYEKTSNSKFSLEDSLSSVNMSMSKQNSNPLGEITFFNKQWE